MKLSGEPPTYDYAVIGSGFGGSVAALRLAQKGYRVVVLEAGRRWSAETLPQSSWEAPKALWQPALRWFGTLRIELFRHLLVLGGSGVGGGSLIYGNTLYLPLSSFFDRPEIQVQHSGREYAFLCHNSHNSLHY